MHTLLNLALHSCDISLLKTMPKSKGLDAIMFSSISRESEILNKNGTTKFNFTNNLQNQNFSHIAPADQIDVQFNNLTLSIKEGNIFRRRGTKTILNNLSGKMKSGHLTGIIGPSGSGKTTLMSLLAGSKAKPTSGEISINGRVRDLRSFRKMSCYIMQDDHLLPQLTVWESMMVAANLKLNETLTKKVKEQIVTDILWLMGLYFSRDTRAGNLSGGQRKRLSIAMELVNNPPVMFFDEATSGLDSVSSYQCLKILKTLAQGGRNIICTIHQPSARSFEIFDDLYILVHGDCLYKGPQKDMLPFLLKHDIKCPPFHNPADFIMDIACGEYGDVVPKLIEANHNAHGDLLSRFENMDDSKKETEETRPLIGPNDNDKSCLSKEANSQSVITASNHTVLNFQPQIIDQNKSNYNSLDMDPNKKVTSDDMITNITLQNHKPSKTRVLLEKLHLTKKHYLDNSSDAAKKESSRCCCYTCYTNSGTEAPDIYNIHHSPPKSKLNVSFWVQFKVLLVRSFLTILRDTTLTRLRFGCHLAVGLLIGLLYYGIGNEASKVWNNSGCLFFSMLFIMFAALMPTVLTFPIEMMVFIKEHLNYWYSLKCYYLAKTLADLPFQIVFPLIYCTIVYWMTSQPMDMKRFVLFLTLATLTALISQSLGLIIGAGLNLQLAVFLGPLTAIPILLFSGFFINFDTIPPYLRWVSYASYVRYSFEGVLLAIYGFDRAPLKCTEKFCFFKRSKDFLELMDVDNESNFKLDFICLISFFVGLRICVYFVLKYRVLRSKW